MLRQRKAGLPRRFAVACADVNASVAGADMAVVFKQDAMSFAVFSH